MSQTDRDALMDAALMHVPFEGMNRQALMAGARDIGLEPGMVDVLFPGHGADLAAAYHRRGDQRLRESLLADPPQGRFRDRVTEAVWRRLSEADPEFVRAGASVLALPQHAGLAGKLVWESADAIWTALGDSSTDVNWYSKRATLAGVISATVLYWLGDMSEGQADTRAFLERRIDGVMRIEKAKASLRKLPGAEGLARAAFGWIRAPRRRALPGKAR